MYLEFYDSSFVVVKIAVVGSRENGDHCWEFLGSWPLVHFESLSLGLVGPDDWYYFGLFEELFSEGSAEKVWASSDIIGLY